jgi:hypothetical protein
MRFPISNQPNRDKISSLKAKKSSLNDGFDQDMELDDGLDGEDWDENDMDTEHSNSQIASDRLGEALKYAQQLKQDYKNDKSKEVSKALGEIFALFAYPDPRNSPAAHLMDPSGRTPVAEELNSAILSKSFCFLAENVANMYSISWKSFCCGDRESLPTNTNSY